MKIFLAGLITTMLLFSIQSCKDCRKSDIGHFMPKEMFRYVFRDTSTWIYLNATDSIYDTVTLYALRETAEPVDFEEIDCPQKVCMAYYMNMHSSYSNSDFTFCVKDSGITQGTSGSLSDKGTLVFYDFVNVGDSTGEIRYIAYYSGLNISGNLIYNIRKILLKGEGDSQVYLYWSTGIGIVRKELKWSNTNTTIWNVVSWHAKPYN